MKTVLESARSIEEKLNTERALRDVGAIHESDRHFTFPAFHRTAQRVATMMRRAGLQQVEHLLYPTDPARYGDWPAPIGWNATKAVLRLATGRRKGRVILDLKKSPCHLIPHSGATPAGGVFTRIVRAETPASKRGALLLVDRVTPAHLETVRRERALGILTDDSMRWNARRTPQEFGDGVLWNNGAFPQHALDNPVGLQLSPNQGAWMREQLARHKAIRVFVDVDARAYEDALDVVTGILPGSGPEEVHVVAHLAEVGANDNASGVALSIEICRAIRALEKAGELRRRRRSIRLVFAMELIGFTAYYESHPEAGKAALCGLNLDMVGEDHDNCRSELWHCRTPHANGEFSDTLLRRILDASFSRHRWLRKKEREFLFNDNFVTDPMIGVPCPFLGCVPDRYYHSDQDTPNKLSEETLRTIGGAAGAFLHASAAGGLAVASGLLDDLFTEAKKSLASLTSDPSAPAAWFEYECDLAGRRMRSTQSLVASPAARKKLARRRRILQAALRSFATQEIRTARRMRALPSTTLPARQAAWAAGVVPRRVVFGPLTLSDIKSNTKWFPAWSYPLHAVLYWMDGRRTLLDIWQKLDAEFRGYEFRKAVAFVKFLEKHGYVEFR